MKKTHLTIAASVVLLVLLTAFAFRPVSVSGVKDCRVVKGKVTSVFKGGNNDVVFILEGHKENYYINKGLEQGLDLAELKKGLEGKEITIKYPDYWSMLDPDKSVRHIMTIEHSGKTIFSEMK